MRLKLNLFSIGASALLGILLAVGCTQDDNISPLDNVALEERGTLIGTSSNFPLVGLTPTNELVHLLSGPPVTETAVVAIVGLRVAESIMAIDYSTKTKQLYGVSNQSFIYKINLTTGVATPVSLIPMTPAIEGQKVGFDFNPADDLIRIVSDAGQNLRVSPFTGMVVGVDTPLNPGTPSIQGAAYSYGNTHSKAALYDIDVTEQALFVQSPANEGRLVKVGTLGFAFSGDGGFEITQKNMGFAVQYGRSTSIGGGGTAGSGSHDITTEEAYRLLSINLTYGVARSHGRVRPMIGLTSNAR